jgi:hypothetical protein
MAELERELGALAPLIDFPSTPDLASRIREQLDTRPRPVPMRLLLLAAAIAAAAVAVAFAVPDARTAILRFFGIGAVRVEYVDRLPHVRPVRRLDFGQRIDPESAPFRLLRSNLLGDPDATFRRGHVVTLLYGTRTRIRLIVSEIEGSSFTSAVGKQIRRHGTRVAFVPIAGATGPGVWIEGKPHVVRFPGGPLRLARNTLIWQHGPLTLRLEGGFDLQRSLAIARSLR